MSHYQPILRPAPTLDAFADRLAEHGNITLAAEEIGRSATAGYRLFRSLKERLGEQAR